MTGWDLSCPDWRERLRSGRSLVPDLPLDIVSGERAVLAFNKLRLADVPGTPELGDSCGDWFRDVVRALFGSWDPVARMRMIREIFVLVAKKNSKTTYGALLMLLALLFNLRPRATFIMTAPVQDVADLAFAAAKGAIELDEVLRKKLHIREHLKTIVHRESQATLEIMTFDPSVLTGQKVSGGALIDELHVSSKMSKASSAIRQLRGGMLPFPEAFLLFITTQSEDAPAGVFKAELTKARAVRDGKLETPTLPVLYEFPEEVQRPAKGAHPGSEPWRDKSIWPWVTPNNGRSITVERLAEEFETLVAAGDEAEIRAWASQHLNVEIGLGLLSGAWAGALFWEENACALSLDDVLERSDVVVVGIDGGGLDDLLGFAALGRDKVTRQWLAWSRAWAHPIALERRKDISQRLEDFKSDGDLVIVEEIGDDVREVADVVEKIEAAGKLDQVGVDPAGIGGIVDAIAARGVARDRIVGISQGWKLSGAIKTTERKLAEGSLLHGGRPLMAWCVGNARTEQHGNALVITKQTSGTAKIDPLAALFNAVALMSLDPQPPNSEPQLAFF